MVSAALPKDVQIPIANSCNSNCTCCGSISPETPVHITKDCKAVKFRKDKKLSRHESIQESVRNLDTRIREIAEKCLHDTETFYQTLKGQIMQMIKKKEIIEINVEQVVRINKLIRSYFER